MEINYKRVFSLFFFGNFFLVWEFGSEFGVFDIIWLQLLWKRPWNHFYWVKKLPSQILSGLKGQLGPRKGIVVL